jgi:hypothetical protein
MARRSGSVTAVDVPFEDWGLDLFRRGFFDTGICLAPTVLRRLADHRGSAPHVNRRTHLSTVRSLHWPYSTLEARGPIQYALDTDWLAGHIGLELPNPCANYLFEVP